MTTLRFNYQRACVEATEGIVLNVGANEDPAGLRAINPERVINTDLEATDSYLDGRPNRVDVLFDVRQTWPFDNDYAELVVFGDILEHLYPDEAAFAFHEARRVSQKLCVTVPEDDRFKTDEQGVLYSDTGYRTHCFVVTEDYLENLLSQTGWKITDLQVVNYEFVPRGYFVSAERN